jgi:hypothetical protein
MEPLFMEDRDAKEYLRLRRHELQCARQRDLAGSLSPMAASQSAMAISRLASRGLTASRSSAIALRGRQLPHPVVPASSSAPPGSTTPGSCCDRASALVETDQRSSGTRRRSNTASLRLDAAA